MAETKYPIDYLKIHKKAEDKLIVWTCQSGAVLCQMYENSITDSDRGRKQI